MDWPKLYSKTFLNNNYLAGFSLTDIVSKEFSRRFICGYCEALCRDPLEVKGCGHLFCEKCILEHFNNKWQCNNGLCSCPNKDCRNKFHQKDMNPIVLRSICLKQIFAEIDLKCALGCGSIVNASDMNKHEYLLCEKRIVGCPHHGCTVDLPANKITDHIIKCYHRVYYCDYCRIPRTNSGGHDCIEELKKTIESKNKYVSIIFSLKILIPNLLSYKLTV